MTALVLALGASGAVQAQLIATDAWARATVPVQKVTGAFMRLQAKEPVNVVAVESPVAARAEIHEMRMDGEIAQMRPVESLRVVPGADVHLVPAGYHIMLMELKRPLKAGERVPVQLRFQRADGTEGRLTVQAEVRALTAGHGH